MNNATIKDLIKSLQLLCKDKNCSEYIGQAFSNCLFRVDCVKEATPDDLRKIGFTFLNE